MLNGIVENLKLTPEDRESLKSKRGFNDNVIDEMKFKSCGPYLKNEEWFNQVPENFKTILLQKNIVIPYFDPDGSCIYLRAHKYGPEGVPVHVYVPWEYMSDDMDLLVITEGEFKAVASCVMRIPAIGLPGVASFSRKNYNGLVQLLEQINPKRIAICFDNEIKDDPKFPNYKPDFRKRYDTMLYAYIMGHQLENISKKNVRISVLPKEWMVNGKVDIDGVLANEKLTSEHYKKIIEESLTPNEYKSSWNLNPIHTSFLERRLDKFFYTGPIVEQFNCYFLKEGRGESAKLKRISNFVIDVKYTLHDSNGKVDRLCQFYSKYGNSNQVTFQSDVMISKQSFCKFCMEMGDYEFEGSENDLKNIWKYIFMNQDGRIINTIHFNGYDEESEIWFFGNGAYYNDNFYPYGDDNIVWVNDIGYRVNVDMDDIDPPTLSESKESHVTIKRILDHLGAIVDRNNAKVMLGWTIGNFFIPEILKEWGIYPFLFFFGQAQAGKSTIANWISSFFGFDQKGLNFHNSSVVGISRMANQMSMVPVWLEEYRNKDPDIGRKNNYLRGIYDRSTIVKGTKKENHVKTYRARSTLLISGEEHPRDAALNSRCVMFSIFRNQDKQKTTESYLWLEKNKSYFNYLGHYILTHKKELWPKVKDRIFEYISSFDDQNISVSSRNKVQMSIVSGVIDVIAGVDSDFSVYVASKAEEMEAKVSEDQALNIFYDDIYNMINNGRFKNTVYKFSYDKSERIFCLWFNGVYSEWEIHYKGLRNEIPASKSALFENIKKQPYFLSSKNLRIGKRVVSCLVMDASNDRFPQVLKMLEEVVDSDEV